MSESIKENWYILYYGDSCDGTESPTYYGRTTDKQEAVKHLQKIKKGQPYAFGHVQVLAGEGSMVFTDAEHLKDIKEPNEESKLIHIGYTNGYQILYAASDYGAIYPDTENNCHIPVYMLKQHAHRLETTSNGGVTLEKIQEKKSI